MEKTEVRKKLEKVGGERPPPKKNKRERDGGSNDEESKRRLKREGEINIGDKET